MAKKKLESKKQTNLVISLIFLLCITTLVASGYAVVSTTMSGSTNSQMNSIKNTDIDMEVSLTSQCMRSYLTSPYSIYLGVDLLPLHSLCQTHAKEIMQLRRTESSTMKIKVPSQLGRSEENQSGGKKN